MKKAFIEPHKCDHSPFCVAKRICPVGAVYQQVLGFNADIPVVDEDKCISCGKCTKVCPHGAVLMREECNKSAG